MPVLPLRCGVLCLLLVQAAAPVRALADDNTSTTINELTLAQAIGRALSHHPGLERATWQVTGAESEARAAGLWPNPTLDAWTEDWAPESESLGDSKVMVGVTQTVPFPGKKSLERDAARAGVRQAEARLREQRALLERDVTLRFHDGLAAQERLAATRKLVALAQQFAQTAQRRAEAGGAPAQEQLRAEIELERARADLDAVGEEVRLARLELATLMAAPDAADATLVGALSDDASGVYPDQPPIEWLHPRLLAARAGEEKAALSLRRARREAAPDIGVAVAGGRDGITGEGLVEFGVSVPLPLWDASRSRARVVEAEQAAAAADSVAVQLGLHREWRAAVLRWNTASAQVAAYRDRILPRSDEALRLVRLGFEEGKFGFLDLLDTQRTATETRMTYIEKLREMIAARAELEYLRRAAIIEPSSKERQP